MASFKLFLLFVFNKIEKKAGYKNFLRVQRTDFFILFILLCIIASTPHHLYLPSIYFLVFAIIIIIVVVIIYIYYNNLNKNMNSTHNYLSLFIFDMTLII